MQPIKVVIHGASGRVGRVLVDTLCRTPEVKLVGAVDVKVAGEKLMLGDGSAIPFSNDLAQVITNTQPEVMVDFSLAHAAMPAIRIASKHKVNSVVGTTGFSASEVAEMEQLANTNKMIKHYKGSTGVKTGFTQEAKYCLSASAKRGETHLVSATLGAETSPERFKDASTLLNFGFANYESVKLCSKDDNMATLTLDKAEDNKVSLAAKENLTVLIKKGGNKDFTREVKINENPSIPIKKGTVLGQVEVYQGKKMVGAVDLVNVKDINKASYLQMLQRVIDSML